MLTALSLVSSSAVPHFPYPIVVASFIRTSHTCLKVYETFFRNRFLNRPLFVEPNGNQTESLLLPSTLPYTETSTAYLQVLLRDSAGFSFLYYAAKPHDHLY